MADNEGEQVDPDVSSPDSDIDAAIAAATEAVAGAQENATIQLEEADESITKDREKTRRFVIISLLGVYGAALLIYSLWVIFAPPTIDGYVCADQAAETAGLCTGRWVQTTDALNDVVVAWILPVLTLAIGYYFGKGAEGDA